MLCPNESVYKEATVCQIDDFALTGERILMTWLLNFAVMKWTTENQQEDVVRSMFQFIHKNTKFFKKPSWFKLTPQQKDGGVDLFVRFKFTEISEFNDKLKRYFNLCIATDLTIDKEYFYFIVQLKYRSNSNVYTVKLQSFIDAVVRLRAKRKIIIPLIICNTGLSREAKLKCAMHNILFLNGECWKKILILMTNDEHISNLVEMIKKHSLPNDRSLIENSSYIMTNQNNSNR